MLATEIKKDALANGISAASLKRAKMDSKIPSDKDPADGKVLLAAAVTPTHPNTLSLLNPLQVRSPIQVAQPLNQMNTLNSLQKHNALTSEEVQEAQPRTTMNPFEYTLLPGKRFKGIKGFNSVSRSARTGGTR
jgi:hypothetical protein